MMLKLTGLDRYNLPEMFQTAISEGKGFEMLALSEILETTVIKTDEWNALGITRESADRITWDPELMNAEFEYDFNEHQIQLLVDTANNLDKLNKVSIRNVKTWEKFKELI